MSERWLPVVGFEGRYEVSDLGRIKSLAKVKGFMIKPEEIMTPVKGTRGYFQVILRKNRKQYCRLIHLEVLKAFVGPCPSESHVGDHDNNNALDNRLVNLYWRTQQQNCVNRRPCGKSGIRNVRYLGAGSVKPWEVRMKKDGELAFRECHETLLDAVSARFRAQKVLHDF